MSRKTEMASEVYSFQVSVVGEPTWGRVVAARTRGAAKADYWRDVNESWDVPFTSLRVKKLGPITRARSAENSRGFIRVRDYRAKSCPHVSEMKIGERVICENRAGVIVGANDSANFDVMLDGDNHASNVHPAYIRAETER